MKRTQSLYIFEPKVNAGKMIFLFGPRQVGKTTFVRNKLKELEIDYLYFNWDDPSVKKEYLKNSHFLKSYLAKSDLELPLVVFDEIHKHKNWKNILKGLYDVYAGQAQFVVTGSARLDYFRQSGDSLVGRYFSYRMLPLGLTEASGNFEFILNNDDLLGNPAKNLLKFIQKIDSNKFHKPLLGLFEFGGFPEPFIKSNKEFSFKWRKDYCSLLIYEDLRDLTHIHDIKGIEQLSLLLPERVGSPLSINSLKEILQVNHKTVSVWVEALKKIYLIFTVLPWSKSIAKAIKREVKVYFFDWTMIEDAGTRFENAVAVFLLRLICRWNELGIGDFDLRYVRNQQGQEVDFLIIKNQKPFALFEAKISDKTIMKSGIYFSRMLNIPYYQIILDGDIIEEYSENKFLVSASRILPLFG